VILPVYYKQTKVGEHRADLIVEEKVLLELKAVQQVCEQHVAQVMSTMRAAEIRIALLINFAEARVVDGIRRVIL